MNTPNLAPDDWFKSSYSQGQGECVEVAFRPRTVAVRDSKTTDGPQLQFTGPAWLALIETVQGDQPNH